MEGRMQTKLWRSEGKVFYIPGYKKREVREKFGSCRIVDSCIVQSSGELRERSGNEFFIVVKKPRDFMTNG